MITRFAVARRARCERGVTLPELIGVLAILLVVLTPLVGAFASALRHESDQAQRETAHASARLALQRMRTDAHCAVGVTGVGQNGYGGFTLTLTQAAQAEAGWCEGVIPAGSGAAGVQWCTIPVAGSTDRWRLYRFLGLDSAECDGGPGSTFQIDFIAPPAAGWPANAGVISAPGSWAGNVWPTPGPCASGHLPTLAIDIATATDATAAPHRRYELRDALALRNAVRCA